MFKALKKYAVFSGRASRSEYWLFFLLMIAALLLSYPVDRAMGTLNFANDIGLIEACLYLFFLLPSLGVSVRRLHDINRTGWWVLIQLVPFVGFIIMIIFACLRGTEGDNKYGPNPLEA